MKDQLFYSFINPVRTWAAQSHKPPPQKHRTVQGQKNLFKVFRHEKYINTFHFLKLKNNGIFLNTFLLKRTSLSRNVEIEMSVKERDQQIYNDHS